MLHVPEGVAVDVAEDVEPDADRRVVLVEEVVQEAEEAAVPVGVEVMRIMSRSSRNSAFICRIRSSRLIPSICFPK